MNLLRSGASGGRFAGSLAASILLHGLILLPWPLLVNPRKPSVPEPLQVSLKIPEPVRELATQTVVEEPPQPPPQKPSAVPPASTFVKPPPPRELKGKALNTALAAMTREELYPRDAVQRGLEGRVVLLLNLDDRGRVQAVALASSSGHALLDQAALQAAGRIGGLPGGQRQVLLPVEFQLE